MRAGGECARVKSATLHYKYKLALFSLGALIGVRAEPKIHNVIGKSRAKYGERIEKQP